MWARFLARWLFSCDGLQPRICLQLILSSDATIRRRRRAGPHQRMLLYAHGADPDPDLITPQTPCIPMFPSLQLPRLTV